MNKTLLVMLLLISVGDVSAELLPISNDEMDIETGPLIAKAYDKGVILVNAGPNVLRFVPPLVISEEELAKAVNVVGEILQTL